MKAPVRQRLDQLLSQLGIGTRREVREVIRRGRIKLETEVCLDAGRQVTRGSTILLDGKRLEIAASEERYLLLHKPCGYICSHSESPSIYQLLSPALQRLKPPLESVGRLDLDVSGALLLTNDGSLLHRLTSPRSHVEKRYRVQLARPLDAAGQEMLESGTLCLKDEAEPLRAARLTLESPIQVLLTITEGRYHQVKRMFAAVGNHVERLERISCAGLDCTGLEPGEWRELSEEEVGRLREGGKVLP
jgi:16S rRNA pseudouridine516 synthase